MWLMTKARHSKYVDEFAARMTGFMLDELVYALVMSEDCDGEEFDVVKKRLTGKVILSWRAVVQILTFNNALDQTVSPDRYAEDFLRLVWPMDFNHDLRDMGLQLARETDGHGIVLQPFSP